MVINDRHAALREVGHCCFGRSALEFLLDNQRIFIRFHVETHPLAYSQLAGVVYFDLERVLGSGPNDRGITFRGLCPIVQETQHRRRAIENLLICRQHWGCHGEESLVTSGAFQYDIVRSQIDTDRLFLVGSSVYDVIFFGMKNEFSFRKVDDGVGFHVISDSLDNLFQSLSVRFSIVGNGSIVHDIIDGVARIAFGRK